MGPETWNKRKTNFINKIAQTNFSQKAWQYFLSQQSAYQLCVIGHFHPQKTHFEKHKFNKTVVEAIILRAWMDAPVYLVIDQRLKVSMKLMG